MRSFRRAGAPALLATLALAASTVPATGIATGVFAGSTPATAVAAEARTSPLVNVPAGQLVLSTTNTTSALGVGSVTRFGVKPADGPAPQIGTPQPLTEGTDCLMNVGPPEGVLLNFTGLLSPLPRGVTEPYQAVGFRAGSIGVRETRSESFCNQIDTTSPLFTPQIAETLVLALPATLADDFGPLVADAASLDVELRSSNSRILATASLAGKPVAYYELNTGTFQNATPLISGTAPIVTKSATTSPGNVQWNIGGAGDGITFDTLSIRAYRGAISLEGGGDGGTARPTTIDLLGTAEETLDCDNPAATEGTTTVTFVGNAGNPQEGCAGEGFGVVLTNGDDFTELLKPLDVDPDAQFVFDLTWTEDANTDWESASPLVKRTTADFDGDAGTSNPPVEIAWCPDLVPTTVGTEEFLVVDNVSGNSALKDQSPNYPSDGDTKQFACIISQKPTLDSETNTLTVEEQIYVYGDIKLQRP